jgi:hypothetical protein
MVPEREKWCQKFSEQFIVPLVFVLANYKKNSHHFFTPFFAFFIFPLLLIPKVTGRNREQPLTNSPYHLTVVQPRSGLLVWRSGGIR